MTMRNRVLLIFSILVVFTLVVAAVGINAVSDAEKQMTELGEKTLLRIRLASEIQSRARAIRARVAEKLIVMRTDKQAAEALQRQIDDLTRENDEASGRFEDIAAKAESAAKLREAIRDRRIEQDRTFALADRGDYDAAIRNFMTAQAEKQKLVGDLTSEIVKYNQRLADEGVATLVSAVNRAFWLLIVVSAIALLTGLVGSWIVSGTIGRMVTDVRNSIAEIYTAAQQQVTSAQQQSTAISENTSTITEIRETGREAADRAKAVGEAAVAASKNAQEGRRISTDVVSQADVTRQKIERMAESILTLSDQVQRIGDIVVSVNEISEQTKILALNASIEAAKAGEEGKGFAVVATQIRDLANQSKEAGGRINAVITDIQKASRESVRDAQEGTKVSSETMQTMGKLADSFQEIATTIEEVSQQVVQVAAGARQQESGINQITTAMAEIDSGMKESLASAQQTLKSIGRIGEQVKTLGAGEARAEGRNGHAGEHK